jgi:glycosyltransferase involved in cell wall biosynthesis
MDQKKLKIYIASNVGIDYFFFLEKILCNFGHLVMPIYSISELKYRSYSKSNILKKKYLRFTMYVLYPFKLFYYAFISKKRSVFIITSNTFFAPYFITFLFSWKKIKVIHLLYDLFPDALEIAGIINVNSNASKIIGMIMHKSLTKCNTTVFLGNFLKNHAEFRWGICNKSSVIDISTDFSLYKKNYVQAPNTKKIVIHYGGQLGYLHAPNNLIECVKYICKSDIADCVEFNFYVSGINSKFIKDSLSEYPVKIISAVPSSQWREDILNFHIGLVSLSPGGATVCLPSKTYGMMAGGLAIIAIAPIWSDLSNLINVNNCGWVINNSIHNNQIEITSNNYLNQIKESKSDKDVATDFYLTLKNILDNRNQLEIKRLNSFNSVRSNFNIDSIGEKWENVLNQI